ncbi:MAG TPA: sigma-54 dependent transcriptional regulator [Gemmataceae bacterium]|nr:sigma-54 dependent transcriptional regulator [Gemmataceae bacterium]
MARLLLIDDDTHLAAYLEDQLTQRGHLVRCEEEAEPALDVLQDSEFEVVLADCWLPGMSGLEFLADLRRRGIAVPVLIMTGQTTPDTAIRARQLGAWDYVVKPLDAKQLVNTLEPLIEEMLKIIRLNRERVHLPPQDMTVPREASSPILLGNSEPMQKIYKRIADLARSNLSVLILGETGTGKELIARAIFHYSDRSAKPFVAVNCAAIPEQLLESELFGHEKGAFTGADRRRIGKFEQADGGTILLDEIGDMSYSTQAKILRVLQEGELVRLGGNEVLKIEVRVIACTNRDLKAAMGENTFREDLYYRLAAAEIPVPSLRERGASDIELLANGFLSREPRGEGQPPLTFHKTALEKLRAYPWRGNVRELKNVIQRAALVCRGLQILPDDLELRPDQLRDKKSLDREDALAALGTAIQWAWDTGQDNLWAMLSDRLKHEMIRFALAECDDKKVQAAKRLGISRTTLDNCLDEESQSQQT